MKKLINFSVTVLFLNVVLTTLSYGQAEENRTKMQLTVVFGGKTIVTDLNSVGTSLTRSYDEQPPVPAVKDTAKSKLMANYPGSFYLTMDAKKISDELLKVFAKKQNHFDGSITIVDSYGKNPTRTIKFKKASLYTYSDQLSGSSYNDAYGATAIALYCQEVSINGIDIEQ